MARPMRAAGLWPAKKKEKEEEQPPLAAHKPPAEEEPVDSEPPPPKVRAKARAKASRGPLYSFTVKLYLDQRAFLESQGEARKEPTAPGKGMASAVLRELLDAAMEAEE